MAQDPATFAARTVQVTSPHGSGNQPLHVAVARISEVTNIEPDAIEDSLLSGDILVAGGVEYAVLRYSTHDIIQAEEEGPADRWAVVVYSIDGFRHVVEAGLSRPAAWSRVQILRDALRTWLTV